MVSCMEAMKLSSTWTLSFSFHSLYWVVEGRVTSARKWREEEQLEIENLPLDFAAATAVESLFTLLVLLGLLGMKAMPSLSQAPK